METGVAHHPVVVRIYFSHQYLYSKQLLHPSPCNYWNLGRNPPASHPFVHQIQIYPPEASRPRNVCCAVYLPDSGTLNYGHGSWPNCAIKSYQRATLMKYLGNRNRNHRTDWVAGGLQVLRISSLMSITDVKSIHCHPAPHVCGTRILRALDQHLDIGYSLRIMSCLSALANQPNTSLVSTVPITCSRYHDQEHE